MDLTSAEKATLREEPPAQETPPRLVASVLVTAAVMFIVMTLFQAVKHLVDPEIGLWESHLITTAFAAAAAAAAAWYILKKHHRLHRQAALEAESRRRTEEALQESEQRFRTFADFTYDWESWTGPDGRFIYVTPSCQVITGWAAEDFLKEPGLILRLTHPDDRRLVNDHLNGYGPEKGVLQFDFRIITRDGEEKWISHHSQPVFAPDGTWLGRRLSHRDISRRMKALGEREKLIGELNQALAKVKTLTGLLPICASCKKVRNDEGYWEQIEEYISNHSEADFTHSICPECRQKLYGDYFPPEN
ncbi:MAG: PAS domain-containing protein [Thermodesulfobacteriota bacterium]